MMDREKLDRERENVFEAARRSYQAAMQNAFSLQERTLDLARSMLEGSAEASREGAERNRAMFEELAEQTRRQQEALEGLLRGAAGAYVDLLWAPFSYYREVVESMTPPVGRRVEKLAGETVVEHAAPPQEEEEREAPQEEAPQEEREPEGGPPIEDYDSLSIKEISARLDDLSVEEIERLRSYEAANKNRTTLLKRLDTRIKTNI